MAIFRFRIVLPIAVLLLINACATSNNLDATKKVELGNQHEAVLARPNWQLSGRLNVRRANQSDTVSINWQQRGNDFNITLSSTVLGLGTTRVIGNEAGVSLEKSGEATVVLPSLQALTRDYLGFDFPAIHLLYWVRGVPVPGLAAVTTFNDSNVLTALTQTDSDGTRWQLVYDRHEYVEGLPLPGRVRLLEGDLQLTFLIQQWQFAAAR